MSKYYIRDDDISYWTNIEELVGIYSIFWSRGSNISFSVVPFSVQSINRGRGRFEYYQCTEERSIGENKTLVDFLSERIRKKSITIMLHGYNHQYKLSFGSKKNAFLITKDQLMLLRTTKQSARLFGEYNWKSFDEMLQQTKYGKQYLEDLFKVKVKIFVPPGNDISSDGGKVISMCKLNLCGKMYLKRMNRPINIWTIKNAINLILWKIFHNDVYPFVLNYGLNQEIAAHGFVPNTSLNRLINNWLECKKYDAPFVLATHHWEINNNNELKDIFFQLSKRIGSPVHSLNEVFKNS